MAISWTPARPLFAGLLQALDEGVGGAADLGQLGQLLGEELVTLALRLAEGLPLVAAGLLLGQPVGMSLLNTVHGAVRMKPAEQDGQDRKEQDPDRAALDD